MPIFNEFYVYRRGLFTALILVPLFALSACVSQETPDANSSANLSSTESSIATISSSSQASLPPAISSDSPSSSTQNSIANSSLAQSSAMPESDQDSEFNSRNVPRDQKVGFIIGQDTSTLRDFYHEVLSNGAHQDFPMPAGVTLYTSILPTTLHANSAPNDASLYISGIEGPPADNNNGEVDFQETLAAYDGALIARGASRKSALAVGLYISDEWNDCANQPLRAIINNGDDDLGILSDPNSPTSQWRYAIDRMINWFKAQERPVYFRIGYEFDGPWNCYNQDFYKRAFRYIKSRINELGADNVATVWQAATYPDNGDGRYNYDLTSNSATLAQSLAHHYDSWYPGDDIVDWVAISFFAGSEYLQTQWSCQDASKPWTVPDASPRELQDTLVQFARTHHKPVMIAESAPQGFNLKELHYSCVAARQNQMPLTNGEQAWQLFFRDYFDWIAANDDTVRLAAYINTDWQSQGRWFCAEGADACASGYWGVTSLQDNAAVLANIKQTLRQDTFHWQGVYGQSPSMPMQPQSSSSVSSQNSSLSSTASSQVALSSSSTQSSAISNPTPNQCPASHPLFACNQCYTDQAQATASGCPQGSQTFQPNEPTIPEDMPAPLPLSKSFDVDGGTWIDDHGVVISRRAERYRVRHELSDSNFNNYNVEYWVGRFGWFEMRDYTRAEASSLRATHCGNNEACVVVTLYGALPAAMTDAEGNNKDCNQQVPNWRYHKTYGNETDFFYGYVMDIVNEDGTTVPACSATLAQRENATVWRAVMRPDRNIPRGFSEGDQIEFETTINFNRAQTFGDNVNYYGQTHKYVLGRGFTVNNQDTAIGITGINDDFATLGGDTTLNQLSKTSGDEQRFAFMQHAANIAPNNIQDFLNGRRLFHTNFETGRHVEEFKPGPQAVGGNLPFPEYAGFANDPIQPSCTQCHFLNGNNSVQNTQQVVPPKMIGLGLLEAISDEQIEAWSAENGGTISRVEFNGQTQIGRFGWTATSVNIQHQVAKALRDDMGIATSIFPVNDHAIDDKALADLTAYSSLLAVPVPRDNLTQMPGHTYFQNAGCDNCHKMTVTTGDHTISALAHQTIHPYTDLLLHDLGEGFYRTAPLWGLGLSGYVRTGDAETWYLMHDGLSANLNAAIERHQGEAANSTQLFKQFSAAQQHAVLNYLRAL